MFLAVSCGEVSNQAKENTSKEVEEISNVVEVVEENVYPYFAGVEFDKENVTTEEQLSELIQNFDGNPKDIVFASTITENCQKKGCWMNVTVGKEDVRVSFKDYDFFVPLDSKGHETVLNGTLYYDTLTVEQLKHYAMDANASQDSLDKITEPIITLSYEATGVYVN
jgi:ABC-type uncharacterized transport system substrate-binding protein